MTHGFDLARPLGTMTIGEFLEMFDEHLHTTNIQTAHVQTGTAPKHLVYGLRGINELPATPTRMVVGKAKEPTLLQTFWDNLPDEFEAKDFKAIAQSIGLAIPTAERYIRAWTGTRLEKVMRGKYRKRQENR